mgnify:CR=1 FL=1
MTYISGNMVRKQLINKEFNCKFCRVRSIVYMYGNDVIRRNSAISAEAEFFHRERLKRSRDWCVRELIRLNRTYADRGRFLVKRIDKEDEIQKEELLMEVYEIGIELLDQLEL